MFDIIPLGLHFTTLPPRREHRFIVIYCTNGKGRIEIDDETYSIAAGEFLTVTSMQVYHFLELIQIDGYVIKFSYDFFCRDNKSVELIFNNNLFCHFGLNEVVKVDNNPIKEAIEFYLKVLSGEYKNKKKGYMEKIHGALRLLIIDLSRLKPDIHSSKVPNPVFLRFLNMIREDFTNRYSLKDLAKKLSISESGLYQLSIDITGVSIQQLINDMLILEAKRLFKYQKLSVKEVAYSLGFNDPHYFSRFFKKQTNQRATDYINILEHR
ncbi:MAG: AraC family transcriptional regulator [Cyclobacteriaceae bacterium]|nr:AraC family transcriptional regulator [Cyclobacteriaceae bacterium]